MTDLRPIVGEERKALVESILKRIAEDEQVVGAVDRTAVWENGWREALARFRAKPVLESLVPAFIHLERPVRYMQQFCEPSEQKNELTFVYTMQEIIGEYLRPCPVITEFGCGTGYNLFSLAERFPEKHFYGFDFVDSAVELVTEAAWALQRQVEAFRFDMREPNYNFKLGGRVGVFTFGAVEQLAGDFGNF
ncbi:MAG: class I SAM-dependent methyltransferase, partial [Patescibacteria group bacterium]|nr:class I SAM-dependent methyltransferase [Patescibacteria group bacterium]